MPMPSPGTATPTMSMAVPLEAYSADHVFISEPTNNVVLPCSTFARIIYSTPTVSMNGLYLWVCIGPHVAEPHYEKYHHVFRPRDVESTIVALERIEWDMLSRAKAASHKTAKRVLGAVMRSGVIRATANESHAQHSLAAPPDGGRGDAEQTGSHILLKIAGVWETATEFGLTYRFISAPRGRGRVRGFTPG